jgi:hypothetical protein
LIATVSRACDGRIALALGRAPTASDITLVLNCVEELKKRVPTK